MANLSRNLVMDEMDEMGTSESPPVHIVHFVHIVHSVHPNAPSERCVGALPAALAGAWGEACHGVA